MHQVAGRARLLLSGSSTLTSTVLEHGPAGEVLLIVYPVLLRTGMRFFAEGTAAQAFELVSTRAFPSSIVFSQFKIAGPLKVGWVEGLGKRVDTSRNRNG